MTNNPVADLVAVKPLEWKDGTIFDEDEGPIYSEAVGAGYTYCAEALDCTLDAAKAEAQAEYEARILAALAPASAEPVADMSLQFRINEIGSQIHNIVCEYQDDDELSERLVELRGRLWSLAVEMAHSAPVTVEAADHLSIAKERDELWAEVERLRRTLRGYKEDLCEGYCNEDGWGDAGHCHPDMQRDCGGCKAACALQRKEGNE